MKKEIPKFSFVNDRIYWNKDDKLTLVAGGKEIKFNLKQRLKILFTGKL